MITRHPQRAEPRTAAGEILLSHNHIALLHGLYDRPKGRASSRAEWVRAAWPYAERMRSGGSAWGLRGSMITMHPRWVDQRRRGRFIEATLTGVGRGIVERKLAARVRGRGAYEGLGSVDAIGLIAKQSIVPDDFTRKAVAYEKAFGLPLLEQNALKRPNGKIFAVTTGLGKPFRIICHEELERRGPRWWHLELTRQMIETGYVPPAYLQQFSEYDADDVLCHLRELQASEADIETYTRTYSGICQQRLKLHTFSD